MIEYDVRVASYLKMEAEKIEEIKKLIEQMKTQDTKVVVRNSEVIQEDPVRNTAHDIIDVFEDLLSDVPMKQLMSIFIVFDAEEPAKHHWVLIQTNREAAINVFCEEFGMEQGEFESSFYIEEVNPLGGIKLAYPSDDREGNEDEACFFGEPYYNLEDKITSMLLERLW